VLTIFRATASDQLSVAIKGVTVTGGVNDSTPDGAVTFGGGISIPVAQLSSPPFNGTGASVRIDETVITGNVVRSTDVIPPGFCGPFVCGFNSGGGIDNGGALTLVDSRVTNNTAGSTPSLATLATDVSAGGISTHFASTLVMRRTVVSGNRASVTLPNGQEAVAGGIADRAGEAVERM